MFVAGVGGGTVHDLLHIQLPCSSSSRAGTARVCTMCSLLPLDDIAVDWVNNKLYFTEAILSAVLVLDIEQRKKTTLIVNRNTTSTTRAIAVDPTTGYITLPAICCVYTLVTRAIN